MTGAIAISVETAALEVFTITSNLTNCTTSNTATEATENSNYTAKITPNASCTLKSLSCTMGGVEVAITGYTITISKVTGDIVITAVAEEAASYAINATLSNVINSNALPSVPEGDPYSTYLVPSAGCIITDASCTMGDQEVTISTGYIIDITSVTADVNLVATAVEGTVDTLVTDFYAADAKVSAETEINFLNGDYVECQMNLSSC